MTNIQYGVIREVHEKEVTVQVKNQQLVIPVTAATEKAIAEVLVDGLLIVAVDLDTEQLVFDTNMNEQHMPHLVDAAEAI